MYYGVGGAKKKKGEQKDFYMLKKIHRVPEALLLSSEGCFSLQQGNNNSKIVGNFLGEHYTLLASSICQWAAGYKDM